MSLTGGDPVNVRPGGTQTCSGTVSELDGQLPHMEGHPRVNESFIQYPPIYSAHNHSKGNCLFDQANPTQD